MIAQIVHKIIVRLLGRRGEHAEDQLIETVLVVQREGMKIRRFQRDTSLGGIVFGCQPEGAWHHSVTHTVSGCGKFIEDAWVQSDIVDGRATGAERSKSEFLGHFRTQKYRQKFLKLLHILIAFVSCNSI